MSQDLWTYKQLAEHLSLPIGTAYAWVSQGRIPYIRISGRCVRFDPGEIRVWLDARRMGVKVDETVESMPPECA